MQDGPTVGRSLHLQVNFSVHHSILEKYSNILEVSYERNFLSINMFTWNAQYFKKNFTDINGAICRNFPPPTCLTLKKKKKKEKQPESPVSFVCQHVAASVR